MGSTISEPIRDPGTQVSPMYPHDFTGISFNDPDIHVNPHEASSMIERYSSFLELLTANTAKGMVMPPIREYAPPPPASALLMRPRDVSPTPSSISENARGQLILVAMPAYNEESTIAKVILGVRKHVKHVLVVDDGSNDATAEIAEALGALVIRHHENRGYGGALQTIFKTAKELAADALVILDSDGQHNPDEIPSLLKPLKEGIDVVIGSRFIGKNGNHIPAYRVVGMKILDTATKFAGNLDVTDTQSGFRAYGKEAIATIKVSGDGMSAGSEILLQAQDHNLSVAEVPISVRYDVRNGSKKNPISHGLDVLGHIIGIIGYKRPLISFGVPGAVLTLFGAGTTIFTITELYTGGAFHSVLFVIGITSLILGLLLVTTSLILNSLVQVMRVDKHAV